MAQLYPSLAWVQAYVPDATAAYVLPGPSHGSLIIGVIGPASTPLGLHQFNGRRVGFRVMEVKPTHDERFGPPIPLS